MISVPSVLSVLSHWAVVHGVWCTSAVWVTASDEGQRWKHVLNWLGIFLANWKGRRITFDYSEYWEFVPPFFLHTVQSEWVDLECGIITDTSFTPLGGRSYVLSQIFSESGAIETMCDLSEITRARKYVRLLIMYWFQNIYFSRWQQSHPIWKISFINFESY